MTWGSDGWMWQCPLERMGWMCMKYSFPVWHSSSTLNATPQSKSLIRLRLTSEQSSLLLMGIICRQPERILLTFNVVIIMTFNHSEKSNRNWNKWMMKGKTIKNIDEIYEWIECIFAINAYTIGINAEKNNANKIN